MAQDTEKQAPAEPSGLASTLDRTFGLTAAGSSVPTELRAGLATFLTMAYIMFVNPAILEKAGMDHGAVFVATCLAAALSTAIMGLYANYPIALAPGMGLNAYFAFTMVPELGGNWQLALAVVFLSGALFLVISVTPLREWLINAIPYNLKLGIAAGIGLFLALIGLQNAGLVAADPTTLVKLGDLTQAKALLAIAGFLVIAGLAARKVPGAIIFGVHRRHARRGVARARALARRCRHAAFARADLPQDGSRRGLSARARHHGAHAASGHAARHGRNADRRSAPGWISRQRRTPPASPPGAARRFRRDHARRSRSAPPPPPPISRAPRAWRRGAARGLTALAVAALFLASLFLAPARPDRAALRHGAGTALRRVPDGDEPWRHRLGRAHRIHPGAHHRSDDPLELFHRHRHRPRLHRLCGAEGCSPGRVHEINAASAVIAGAFLLKLIFA